MSPPELSKPPADLEARRITVIKIEETLFRTHGITRNPESVGHPGLNRFDAPDGSYKVLYLGRDAYCAFIETFAHSAGTKIVTTAALKIKALSELKPVRPLLLIDLTASGPLVRIGADARLFSAGYDISQLWSKAFHDHSVGAHGMLYPSRLDPQKHAIAIFRDRAPKLLEFNRQSWYAPGKQRLLLAEIAEHYGIELIETRIVASRKPPASVRQESFLDD